MQQNAAAQLFAVIYRFEVWRGGDRQLVTEEQVPASTLGMLVPQLNAVAKRSRVDAAPGLLVFDNFPQARQAAQTLASIASRVRLCEVAAGAASGAGEAWQASGGATYRAVPGGVSIQVKA